MIKLGDRVRDRITGLEGIAYGITDWLYGCKRVNVQPQGHKDGKQYEMFCTDIDQLEIVEVGVCAAPHEEKIKSKGFTGGPTSDVRQMHIGGTR